MYGGGHRGILREEDKGRGEGGGGGGGGDKNGNDMDNTDGTDDTGVGNLLPPGGI